MQHISRSKPAWTDGMEKAHIVITERSSNHSPRANCG